MTVTSVLSECIILKEQSPWQAKTQFTALKQNSSNFSISLYLVEGFLCNHDVYIFEKKAVIIKFDKV